MSVLLRLVLVVGVALLVAGCGASGPAIVPVTGIVTLDGAPVEGATVTFVSKVGNRMADGKTDAAGKFSLTTQDAKPTPGALEGEHSVTVNGARVVGANVGADGTSVDATSAKIEWFLPQQYAQPDTSGLTATVKKGMEPVQLNLTAK